MKRYTVYILVILVLVISFFYYLRDLSIENLKSRYTQSSAKKLLSSQNTYDKLSSNFYNNHNEDLGDHLKEFLDLNSSSRAIAKREIIKSFFQIYKNLTFIGLNQFQIFSKDGISILRFDNIKMSDENISLSRDSIKKNINGYRFIKGFEVERLGDGLRYIYPLFYDKEYVGGYEWSWSHSSIIDELKKIYGGWYLIVIDKKILVEKMDISLIKKNYKALTGHPGLLYQKDNIKLYSNESISFLKHLFSKLYFHGRVEEKGDFTEIHSFKEGDFIVSFNIIKDILDRPIGFFISVDKTDEIEKIDSIFGVEVFFSIIIMLMVYTFLYMSHRDKLFIRTLMDSQKDMVILTNGEKLKDANRRFLNFFEVSNVSEFIQKYGCVCEQFIDIESSFSKKVKKRDGKWINRLLSKQKSDKKINMFDKHRGEERTFMVSISQFEDTRSYYVVVFSDITEIEQEKHNLKTESMIDHLTKVGNKRTFEMHLLKKIYEVKHHKKEKTALIMFDIDHFKEINDKFGHTMGDKVLIEIAAIVKNSIGQNDMVYRWGGEEFAIIIDDSFFDKAMTFAEGLKDIISSYDFPINRVVTCSFGVTMVKPEDTKESIIERVDVNLYRAKNAGRNRVEGDIER